MILVRSLQFQLLSLHSTLPRLIATYTDAATRKTAPTRERDHMEGTWGHRRHTGRPETEESYEEHPVEQNRTHRSV